MKFTILGGRGFIGATMVKYLTEAGHDVHVPKRDLSDIDKKSAGHIMYAIGLTGDFRTRPYDTVDAHVTLLAALLREVQFESWLYLSSTRLYGAGVRASAVTEESDICLRPCADSLYDLSKLTGEALCLAHPRDSVRVARLSNVVGVGQSEATFLGAVLKELSDSNDTVVLESADSSKDYIDVDEVTRALTSIATSGRHRLYNVASGVQTTHAEIGNIIHRHCGKSLSFAPGGAARTFPEISIERLKREFPEFRPRPIRAVIEDML